MLYIGLILPTVKIVGMNFAETGFSGDIAIKWVMLMIRELPNVQLELIGCLEEEEEVLRALLPLNIIHRIKFEEYQPHAEEM